MGKRRKGKGKGRKRPSAMTRRAPDAGSKSSSAKGSDDELDDGDDADASESKTSKSEAAKGADDAPAESEPAPDSSPDPSEDADSEPPPAKQPADDDGVAAQDESDDGLEDLPESTVGLPGGAAWALPFVKLEHRWTWLEVRMMFSALIALMVVLVFWAAVGSMADSVESTVPKGTLFRMIAGASVLAIIVRVATNKRLDDTKRAWLTFAAVVVGVFTARFWRGSGIEFFDGLNDWLQKGSVFALFGGLKGVSTRLTMFVSLVGGSLAAASGTHIAIDAVTRIIPKPTRAPVSVAAACATAFVCFLAAWGFFDHVAITALGAKLDDTPGAKVSASVERIDEHFFLLRKQLKLDLKTLPRVLKSEPWNDEKAFTGRDWNQFIDDNGFAERYGAEVERIRAPESALDTGYQPFVKRPGEGAAGQLTDSVDLMWPIGFLMIGLRFLLRSLLVFAGHVKIEEEIEIEADDDDAATEGAS